MKINCIYFLLLALLFTSCNDEVLPKPKAFLKLTYPEATYQRVESGCPFTFQISQNSIINFEDNCWLKIKYPSLNATIHVTYRNINGNLNEVLQEVEKLTFEHTIKADGIGISQPYENNYSRVYGKIINVEGDVASNIQFHATDSIKNVLYGSLYFNVRPNYDSIYPAIKYIEKDIKNLMQSIAWKD